MSTVSPLFVGRDSERAQLGRALEQVRDGTPATVLIGGEAGVGKTRLIQEVFSGARVFLGGCLELGTDGLPFAPFTAILRDLVREIGTDGVADLMPGGNTRALARLLPEFGDPGAAGDDARAQLFEQILGLFERLSEDATTVVVIEDAHWADHSTRDLLSFLVRYQSSGSRLLLIVTYRTDELHRRHPLRPLLAELGRVGWVTRLEVPRLTRKEVIEQARGILSRDPGDIEAVFERSEGNPLYVEALLQSEGETLPDSLRDLLLAGVERLPEETQDILRVASAGGVRIEHALLAAVTGTDDSALRPAVAGNILVIEGDRYAFRHALIREAIHDDLLPGERTRLHTRFAEALEADAALLPSPRREIELAHHWHAAHDNTWGLISAWRAAAAARDSLAYEEQVHMLTRVLELWDRVPDAAERIGADHITALHHAAVASYPAGEFERGYAFADAALAEIDESAEPERTARLLRLRGIFGMEMGRPRFRDDLRRAVRLVTSDPPTRLYARILAGLSRMLTLEADGDEKLITAERAYAAAVETGDNAMQAEALDTIAWIRCDYAAMEESRATWAKARRLVEGRADPDVLMRIAISESDSLEGAGWHEAAVEVARRAIADANSYGLARTRGTFLAMNLSEPLVSLGRWDEALEVIDHALSLNPPERSKVSLRGCATEVLLARGELDLAESNLRRAEEYLRGGSYKNESLLPHAYRMVDLHLARNRPDEARRVLERAMDEIDLFATPRYSWPLLVSGAALADMRPELQAIGGKLAVAGPYQAAHQLTFQAITGSGEWGPAIAAWNGLRQPYTEALALLGAALHEVTHGDREEAGAHLSRAAELAGSLSAAPLQAEIESLARRARLSVGRVADAPVLGLTARELEVFRLVAAGRSNREIAEELFIAVKTASVHVSNILGKLGVATRGEAAAEAHRQGLF